MKQTWNPIGDLKTVSVDTVKTNPEAFFDSVLENDQVTAVQLPSGKCVAVLPQENVALFEDNDLRLIIIGALRYSMGRMTYMPDVVSKFIKRHLNLIDENTLNILIRDIKEHLVDYAEHEPYPQTWNSLQLALEARLKELKEDAK